jgi:uncharacterized membrane protein
MPSLGDPDRDRPHWTTWLGGAAAHPAAFAVVIIYALAWLVFDRERFDFNAVATLIVWVMTLFFFSQTGAIRSPSMPSLTSCFARMRTPMLSWQRLMRKSLRLL